MLLESKISNEAAIKEFTGEKEELTKHKRETLQLQRNSKSNLHSLA